MHAATGFPLARHNIFFDDDYASEFNDVFKQRRLPRQGTVYVCAQDRLTTATLRLAANACSRSSTRRQMGTRIPSMPRRSNHANTAAWRCCSTAA